MDRTVHSFVERLGIPREDLLLPCTFCSRFLTQEELTAFDFSAFNLVWRGRCAHGICTACARVCASLDLFLHHQNSRPLADVLRDENLTLHGLKARCRVCMKILSVTEKLECAERGESFAKVRGQWRARCRICKPV
ncbi:E6 protein [Iotapapillomavirus 1]|uniref:Protein E6 n=1 Tax=Mastomys natalensis papillomavirus (isolate African multimammate rat) TaxID=654915 RepID=VE6_MNPVA|nr:E6 protein [Iotapapillomavirus 1]P30735.2 RecName: Full=Protein E6 [Mastomys natalensis papillomavirus (isolate African multimammate rat)]AAA67144.1 E6 protein [Iotapapillomavirus 1]